MMATGTAGRVSILGGMGGAKGGDDVLLAGTGSGGGAMRHITRAPFTEIDSIIFRLLPAAACGFL